MNIKTILPVVVLLFTAPSAYAATYYVDPNGSGTACTSSSPCSLSYYQVDTYDSSIRKININLLPGDTLYFKKGTYLRKTRLDFPASGTAASRIIIAKDPGEPAGDHVIISGDLNGNGIVEENEGPRVPPPGADPAAYHRYIPLVKVSGNYVTLRNIDIAFSSGRGIQTDGQYEILTGSEVHHTWDSGINLYGAYNTAENNVLWRAGESNYCGGAGGNRMCKGNWPGGLDIGESGQATAPGAGHHGTARNNIVFNVSGEGILCMHTENSVIEDNVVYDNWGMGIDLDKCSYSTVQRNLIYYTADKGWWRTVDNSGNVVRPASGIFISNESTVASSDSYPLGHDRTIVNNIIAGAGWGFNFWRGDGSGGEFDKSRLINDLIAYNTFVESQNNGTGLNIQQTGPAVTGHTNTRIANNIILQSSGTVAYVNNAAGITFDHNLWSRQPVSNVSSQTDIIGNPLLVNAGAVRIAGSTPDTWYTLTSASPAINKAISISGVTTDYFRVARPVGAAPDIGAHEYGETGGPTLVPTERPVTPVPSITQTPDGTRITLDVLLHGIGKAGDNVTPGTTGNTNPLHPSRSVTLEILNANNQVVGTKQGTVSYGAANGNFTGVVDLGVISDGVYTLKIKSSQYLKKSVPGIITLTAGQTTAIPQLALVAGDTNSDNALSILDYNILLDCYSDLTPARNCADTNKKLMADLTDDGNVNQFDYNLFLRELSVQSGQ